MKTKHILLFALSVLSFQTLSGQGTDLSYYSRMVPPAPNAAALGKFGDIPVGGASGIPSISIPIYSYAGPDEGLNLPVSLDYFAGGIRVDEMASNVGIGWSLNAGGVISRTLCGIYDEKPSFGFCEYNLPESEYSGNARSNNQFRKMYESLVDSQYDIFNFNFNGRSGKFILGKNNKLLILTQDKLIIEKVVETLAGGQARIKQFTITDEKGYRYVFADMEITLDTYIYSAATYVSSWYLSKIINPSGKNEISFTYGSTTYSYPVGHSRTDVFPLISYSNVRERSSASTPGITVTGKRLEKITFPQGVTLECKYATTARTDLPGDYLLNKLVISGPSSPQHGFILEQDYSVNRATLRKVTPYIMNGSSQVTEGSYRFDYKAALPGRLSSKQDHWGFYNSNSGSFIPRQSVTYNGTTNDYGSGNRSTDFNCLNGSLYRISYSTGGYTDFEMEPNQAKDERLKNQTYAGGLRLKKMTDYTASGQVASTKEYEYLLDDGTSSGTLGVFPVYHYLSYFSWINSSVGTTGMENYPYDYYPTHNNFLTITSSSITSLCNVSGSPVLYSKITERTKNGSTSTGRIERYFKAFDRIIIPNGFPYVPPYFQPWFYGMVQNVKYYDINNTLLKKEEYGYTGTGLKDPEDWASFRSVKISPVVFHNGSSDGNNNVDWNRPLYFITNYFYPQVGNIKPSSKKVTDYSSGGAVASTTSCTYNSNWQVSSETVSSSTGEEVKTLYNYPPDMVSSGRDPQGVYAGMVTRNMTGYIVETITKKGAKQTELTRNNYYNPYTGVYAPKSMEVQVSGNPVEVRAEFTHNPAGRPLTFSKKGDMITVLIWSYNYQYPVIEVKGAGYEKVREGLGYSNDAQVESFASLLSPTDTQIKDLGAKLRNYFKDQAVQVTTYTYKPVGGVTSVTDPAGATTTYEYDASGRFKKAINHNGNTTNYYDYQYKGL